MGFVISRDTGDGKPPLFMKNSVNVFGDLPSAFNFPTEALAHKMIDDNYDVLSDCIILPNDETLLSVTNERSNEELSGMKINTDHLP